MARRKKNQEVALRMEKSQRGNLIPNTQKRRGRRRIRKKRKQRKIVARRKRVEVAAVMTRENGRHMMRELIMGQLGG